MGSRWLAAAATALAVSFAPLSTFAQEFGACDGPRKGTVSYVGRKQEQPPTLVLYPGTGENEKPCASPVAPALVEKPAWQLVEPNDAIRFDLDGTGTMVAMEITADEGVAVGDDRRLAGDVATTDRFAGVGAPAPFPARLQERLRGGCHAIRGTAHGRLAGRSDQQRRAGVTRGLDDTDHDR